MGPCSGDDRPRCPARRSTPSCTSPGPASATTDGPRSTSARWSTAACRAPPPWRRRWPSSAVPGRRCWSAARRSGSTAIAATRCSTSRRPAGDGFLADICRAWEAATAPAEDAGVRVAHIRTGIVLSRHGGALKKMLPLFKLGVGGRFGNGTAVDELDLDPRPGRRAIEHLLTPRRARRRQPHGARRRCATPSSRRRSATCCAGRRCSRCPSFGPKLLLGGELADALLFDGQRVMPGVLQAEGYSFEHPDLASALRAVLAR